MRPVVIFLTLPAYCDARRCRGLCRVPLRLRHIQQRTFTAYVGIGLVGLYDGRDNTFTPNRGLKLDFEAIAHDGDFLGDFTYQKYRLAGQYYWDLRSTADLVLGLREQLAALQEPPLETLP